MEQRFDGNWKAVLGFEDFDFEQLEKHLIDRCYYSTSIDYFLRLSLLYFALVINICYIRFSKCLIKHLYDPYFTCVILKLVSNRFKKKYYYLTFVSFFSSRSWHYRYIILYKD